MIERMLKFRAGGMAVPGRGSRAPVTRVFSLYVVQAGSALPARVRAGLLAIEEPRPARFFRATVGSRSWQGRRSVCRLQGYNSIVDMDDLGDPKFLEEGSLRQ